MPPAFILSQDQTLHLILTQTLLRLLFVNWLLSIKCLFKNRRVNFEYWIVCNQSFQRAICLWSELYHSQGLFILSPVEPDVNNFCEEILYFSQVMYSSLSFGDLHYREAISLALNYSITTDPTVQAFLWIFLFYSQDASLPFEAMLSNEDMWKINLGLLTSHLGLAFEQKLDDSTAAIWSCQPLDQNLFAKICVSLFRKFSSARILLYTRFSGLFWRNIDIQSH